MVLSGSWSHQLDGADIEKDKQGAGDNTQTPGNQSRRKFTSDAT